MLGHDQWTLTASTGRYGVHWCHMYPKKFRARFSKGLVHRAFGGDRIECGPGLHDEHIECVVVLADLPAAGIKKVEHLMENYGMHRERSLIGRPQNQHVVGAAFDRVHEREPQRAGAGVGGEPDPVSQLVADERDRPAEQHGDQKPSARLPGGTGW